MSFLGIDIGSTSIKGAVLEVDPPRIVAVVSEPFPAPVGGLPPGWFDVEPRLVVAACRRIVDRLVGSSAFVDGITWCGQMGGVILVDSAGTALTPFYSWRDQRTLESQPSGTGSYFDRLRQLLSTDDWRAIGHELLPGSASSLLYWLAATGRLPGVDFWPLSLGDHVVQQLTGGRVATTLTLPIGLVDLFTLDWRREFSDRLDLQSVRWPELLPEHTAIGAMVVGGRSVPCYPCVGDHQCALAGTGLQPGELSINVSTGSQVSVLSSSFMPGDYQTRPYFDGRLLNTLTHLPAGRSLNTLVDLLTELGRSAGTVHPDPWHYLAHSAARAPSSELEVELTFFSGPLGDHGAIRQITTDNLTAGSLFRAALRSMAENYARAAARVSPRDGWDRLVLSGGLVQKIPVLRELIVERFAAPYRIAAHQEETLTGLAVLSQAIKDKQGSGWVS